MLKILNGTQAFPLNTDDFCIRHVYSGLDELDFTISVHDEHYPDIYEEAVVEYEQPYLVKAIDRGGDDVSVKCQLDLDELKADMHIGYTNGNATVYDTISGVLPAGWAVVDRAYFTFKRTVESEAATPLEIIQACADIYSVTFQFRPKTRQIEIIDPKSYEPKGAFATQELNLQEINYKGKSSGFATRLYAYGKDGLTFASINDGKPYVDDHTYSDKVISAYWSDDQYETKESLLEEAKSRLKQLAIPERSYECSVVDLAATNPELYKFQDFNLFEVVTLIDDKLYASIDHQVVQYEEYPAQRERNVVTLSSVAPKIQNSVKQLKETIENPRSEFNSRLQNAIQNATDWITGSKGGYLIIHQDENEQPYEMLIMDTPDISTAKEVWRWNQGGLGHSKNGYDGPYETAMTQDGQIVADMITAGTLQGIQIIAERGKIAGWDMSAKALYKDYVVGSTVYRVSIQSPQKATDWAFSSQISTDGGKTFQGAFYVRADGYVYANDIHINGGTINISTESNEISAININWNDNTAKIYGNHIGVKNNTTQKEATLTASSVFVGLETLVDKHLRLQAGTFSDKSSWVWLNNGESEVMMKIDSGSASVQVRNDMGMAEMKTENGVPSIRMSKDGDTAMMDYDHFYNASLS
ncbi:phage tail spike protein [Hominifimenecus sp. rT4P-3]|uniref:phage tail spike protein n=1 Tax=Hominifimenecus sp. rT4P-3 TaxID=3242979 RepID=UPI003DA1D16D